MKTILEERIEALEKRVIEAEAKVEWGDRVIRKFLSIPFIGNSQSFFPLMDEMGIPHRIPDEPKPSFFERVFG